MNPKDFDRWMTTLSDEARADVMKTTIKETQETARRLGTNETYQSSRQVRLFFPLAAIVVLAAIVGARSCEQIERENATAQMRIQAEHPAAFQDAGK
jgi:aryl-alcohol dehydrogenase-like predicted oxidoreductase